MMELATLQLDDQLVHLLTDLNDFGVYKAVRFRHSLCQIPLQSLQLQPQLGIV